jgi:hypothetical protein
MVAAGEAAVHAAAGPPRTMTKHERKAMNGKEFLAAVAAIHNEFLDRYADDIPLDPAYVKTDGPSDYNEHHATVSAPPDLEDEYNARLVALIKEYQTDLGK